MARDYREKKVKGVYFEGLMSFVPHRCDVTVRMTSDNDGASLSLAVKGTMISIALKDVEDIIRIAEKEET